MANIKQVKKVAVTFAGANDVLQHIVPLRDKKLNLGQLSEFNGLNNVSLMFR